MRQAPSRRARPPGAAPPELSVLVPCENDADALQTLGALERQAGDVPLRDDLLAAHHAAHGATAHAVVGDIRPSDGSEACRAVWEASWPSAAPVPPVRHFSAPRTALLAAGGVDERLPELDVAVLDLLVRLHE